MEVQTIIKLHQMGFIDSQGQVCEETVSEIGYEDGEALGISCCKSAPCGEDIQLFELERELKESYRRLGTAEYVESLYILSSIFEHELSKDISVMAASEQVISHYLQHFLMGFSDAILEKASYCRKCQRQ